jgi:hypothetical protein
VDKARVEFQTARAESAVRRLHFEGQHAVATRKSSRLDTATRAKADAEHERAHGITRTLIRVGGAHRDGSDFQT